MFHILATVNLKLPHPVFIFFAQVLEDCCGKCPSAPWISVKMFYSSKSFQIMVCASGVRYTSCQSITRLPWHSSGLSFFTYTALKHTLHYILISRCPAKHTWSNIMQVILWCEKVTKESKWCLKTCCKIHMLTLRLFQISTRNWQFNVALEGSDQEGGRCEKQRHMPKIQPNEYRDSCKEFSRTGDPNFQPQAYYTSVHGTDKISFSEALEK